MKIKDQVMILLGVPLVCQLCCGVILIENLMRVDTAARNEIVAKDIISTLQDVRRTLVEYLSILLSPSLVDLRDIKRVNKFHEQISMKLKTLDQLIASDKEALPIYQSYKAQLISFKELATEFGANEKGFYMTTFLMESEFAKDLFHRFKKIEKVEQQLVSHYRQPGEAFLPRSLKEREDMRNLVIFLVATYTLVVIFLAAIFSQKTLRRLATLMTNIDLFSRGKTALQALEGRDELTDLDRQFKQMAEARWQAEELRRSLFAAVSHDLRSPLTSVGLTLEMVLLKEEEKMAQESLERLSKMSSEIQRLGRMADSILVIEKVETGIVELNKEPTSVESLINSSRQAVYGIAESKEIEVVYSYNTEEMLVCDPDRVIQILINLLSNAVKFSPRASQIQIKASSHPGFTRFEVIDAGPGVPPEEQEKLFQKFSQLKQEQELKRIGSGLGLYIARMLVEAHQGSISYSNTEAGSCFAFDIPRE
ncbi:MAG: HAMP domain-containing histidine kinase [Cyanobacteria bacterium]|nr:HAMP domain-containing histidine kinase [Cyanobacteriota bacterium]